MFERLQQKWKVSGFRLTLILFTFAIGGSLTGYTAKKIMPYFSIEKGTLWIIVYILLVTLLWPIAVLLVSLPFGQLAFFRTYLKKMGKRLTPGKTVHKVAIFASGAGSNAQKIINHFRSHPFIHIQLIVCNKPGAGVLLIAAAEKIPTLLIDKERFYNGDAYVPELKGQCIDFIVLAGFLWKVPVPLITAFPRKIINIHPALLPAYGGQGMYGKKVHEAVIAAGDKESGITVHYIDEIYDHGQIIFQSRCAVTAADTALSLAEKVHQLEHQHFPAVIESLLSK